MLRKILVYSSVLAILFSACKTNKTELTTSKISFNNGWKFHKGDADSAHTIAFNDGNWRSVQVPHDWAIEGPFDSKYNARSGGLPFHGTGWYRKTFSIPAEAKNKAVSILFDGAMYNAHVWVNGQFVGNRPYGYIGFSFDISKLLNYGEENTIAVKLSPEDLSSRWYPGAGLYRNIWIEYNNPTHIKQWGVFITTPEVTPQSVSLNIETEIVKESSESEIEVSHKVLDANGKTVVSISTITKEVKATQKAELKTPNLWGVDTPYLYTLVTTLTKDGVVFDEEQTRFGVRTLKFSKEKGFFLNGKHIQIQGVCLHHDNGPLGAIVNRRAIERKLQIMKSMGVNSIRTSHNMPSPELLDLCDELGLLVQDEAFDVWKMPKIPNGYNKFFGEWGEKDIKDMVLRDRNHPSVFMWSIGNEIMEQWTKDGWKTAKRLNDYVKEIDTTRPTTAGFNSWPDAYSNNMAAQIDIAGMNYHPLEYGAQVEKYIPNKPIVGSETSSCTSTRGEYHLPIEKYKTHESNQVTSYDLIGPPWAYPPDVEFDALEKNPGVLGEYVWTGFDYLGEPTPYGGRDNSTDGYWNDDWPARSSYFGTVDLCGFPKDRFFLYKSQWTKEPMVHVLPHWNWEGAGHETIPVYAYTNCEEVELFVNGKSYGKRIKGQDLTKLIVKFVKYDKGYFMSKYRLSWEVPYAPGSIKVVAYNNGKAVAEKEIKTAGKPAKIAITPDRTEISADGYDLSYIKVRIEDENGNFCPLADNLVKFQVEGAGTIAAVGNGNPSTTIPFIASERPAFNGLCMLIVKAAKTPGEIKIKATSEGLTGAETKVVVSLK